MKNKISTFILFSILFFGLVNITTAQQWKKNLPQKKDGSVTFFDYQKAFNDYWAPYKVEAGYYTNEKGEKTKAGGWKQFKRWEYYWKTRVDNTTGEFPSTTAWEVWQDYKKTLPEENTSSIKSQSGNWITMGPANLDRQNDGALQENGTGRLNCMTFDPNDNNHFWVGAPSGGVWESTDAGSNWSCLTDDNPIIGVSVIALPSDYNKTTNPTMYIATGDRDAVDDPSIGVLKTTDGGATWNTTGLTFTASANTRTTGLVCSETNANTIVASTFKGIYKSTDAGANWTLVQTGLFIDMDLIPGTNTLIATTMSTVLAYRSTDFGSTWSVVYTGVAGSGGEYRLDVATTGASTGIVYLISSYYDTDALYAIYKSTNGGASFTKVYNGLTSPNLFGWTTSDDETDGGQGWYDIAFAISNTNSNVVYVGGVNGWISTNGATSFVNCNIWDDSYGASDEVHADHHNAYFRPSDNRLFDVNDGGVYHCDNVTTGTASDWTSITDGIITGQIYDIGISRATPGLIVAGFQDNGTKLLTNENDIYSWTQKKGGDGMCCDIDHTNTANQWGTYTNLQVSKTTNTWATQTSIRNSGTAAWAGPLESDPITASSVYIGTAYVEIRGTTWTRLSQALDATNYLSALDIYHVGTVKSIWAASPAGCWKSPVSSTASGTYTLLSNLPANAVTDIAIDENDYNHVYLCFGGYDNTNVWETTNNGTSWTDISAGLPAVPTGAIVINEKNTTKHEVYVGTDAGIYVKLGTAPWQLFNTGMPFVSITDLEVYDGGTTSVLYAATYGRGIWKGDCYTPPALDLAIGNIVEPVSVYCDLGTFTPTVAISNIGSTTITAATIEYSIDGGAAVSIGWTGSLTQGSSVNISYPAVALSFGSHSIEFTIVSRNGSGTDESSANDAMSKTYFLSDNSLPYTQNFDNFTIQTGAPGTGFQLDECWNNDAGDSSPNLDFGCLSGSTPSGGTGPSSDHTSGTGKYLFTETSSDDAIQKTANLLSPTFDLTNFVSCSLSFWYHMYGDEMGDVQVDLYYAGSWHNGVSVSWNGSTATGISGNQGDSWYQATADVSAGDGYSDFQVRISFTTGAKVSATNFYMADFAVDDFSITGTGGTVCTPPTTQATNFSATPTSTSMNVSWTRGNGDRVLVVARNGSAVNADPVSGTTYTANAAFGSGTQIGTGNYVVYDGLSTSSNVNVTGLNPNTTYHFAVYEFFVADHCYNVTELIGNDLTIPAQPSTITGSSTPCQGSSQTYSVTNVAGVTYTWAFPSGWIQTGGGTTNSVTVTVGSTSGNVSVTPSNASGSGTARTLAVTVSALPTAPTSVTATQTTICNGDNTTLSYSGGSGTTFGWYSSSCGTGLVGTGNNLSVSPTSTTTYYGRWENACGATTCQTVSITVNDVPAQPSVITGNTTPLQAASETYSVTNVAGVTYTWSVPGGWSIDAGQNTNSIDVTVGALAGTITVTPSNACGDGTARTLSVTPIVGALTWNGSGNSNWQNTANWDSGVVPNSSDNVSIPNGMPNYPIINNGIATIAVCNNLTIENASSLTIDVDGFMTVSGSIANSAGNAGLVINSDATGTGSLIHNTVGGVDATVNTYLAAPIRQWHFIGSPVAAAPFSILPTNESLYFYDETIDDYWTGTTYNSTVSGWDNGIAGNMLLNTGYLMNYYEHTIQYIGQLNNNTTTSAIGIDYTDNGGTALNGSDYNNFDGWNFIANPYTSAINWEDAGINHVAANLDNGVYFYDGTQYSSWVNGAATNGGTQYIPSGQGFFVKANSAGGTLDIPANAIVHNAQAYWKSTYETPLNFIKLRVESGVMADETIIRFNAEATDEHDSNFDAYKLFSHELNMLQLYTLTNNLSELAVNTLSDVNSQVIVPIKLANTPESYNINISEFNFENITVGLKDNLMNTVYELSRDVVIGFTKDESDDSNRFELIFDKNSSNITSNNNFGFNLYPNPNKGSFNLSFNTVIDSYKVEISDVTGKTVYKNTFKNSKISVINLNNQSNGIYFIKVKLNDNSVINEKIIIE